MLCALLGAYLFLHDTHAKNNPMQYYNAKDKFIMKRYGDRGASRRVRRVRRSRRSRRGGGKLNALL